MHPTSSNKKRSSSNNKKKTKSSKQQQQQQQSSSPAKISEWVQSSSLDAKRLSRKLPDAAAAIRNGSLQPKEVPGMVRQAEQDHLMAELQKHIPDIFNMPVSRLGALEIMTGAEHLLCDLVRVACGSDEDLSFAFAFDFFGSRTCPWKNVRETVHMDGTAISHCENYALIFHIHAAYNRACEKRRVEIEQLVRKPIVSH